MSLTEEITEIAQKAVEAESCKLYHLDFKKRGKNWKLKVYIDKEKKVSHEDCAGVSERLGTMLEVEDIINHQYVLEVSSPGLERFLKEPWHYKKQIGETIEVRTYGPVEGKRHFKGELVNYYEDSIKMKVEETMYCISHSDIAKANLVFEL